MIPKRCFRRGKINATHSLNQSKTHGTSSWRCCCCCLFRRCTCENETSHFPERRNRKGADRLVSLFVFMNSTWCHSSLITVSAMLSNWHLLIDLHSDKTCAFTMARSSLAFSSRDTVLPFSVEYHSFKLCLRLIIFPGRSRLLLVWARFRLCDLRIMNDDDNDDEPAFHVRYIKNTTLDNGHGFWEEYDVSKKCWMRICDECMGKVCRASTSFCTYHHQLRQKKAITLATPNVKKKTKRVNKNVTRKMKKVMPLSPTQVSQWQRKAIVLHCSHSRSNQSSTMRMNHPVCLSPSLRH